MVSGRRARVEATLNDKVVGLAPYHVDLGNEKAVDVPGNAPPNMTWKWYREGFLGAFTAIFREGGKYFFGFFIQKARQRPKNGC